MQPRNLSEHMHNQGYDMHKIYGSQSLLCWHFSQPSNVLSNSTAKIIISYVIRGPFLMEKVHLWTKSERLVDMSKIVKQWLLCLCCHAAGPKHVTRKVTAIGCHVRQKKKNIFLTIYFVASLARTAEFSKCNVTFSRIWQIG